jgi:uncharacterized protein
VSPQILEIPLVFECGGELCVGVLAKNRLNRSSASVAVVVVVGGPQYRIGSHRQFVSLARALASAGVPTLRFDYRGMGDSSGSMRTFEDAGLDISESVDLVCKHTGVDKVVLWGLCDGASASLMYAPHDKRIAGLVCVNPWVRSEQSLAKVRVKHYYAGRFLQWDFWRKLARGRIDASRSCSEILAAMRTMLSARKEPFYGPVVKTHSFLDRMERGLREFSAPVLLVLSGNDFTAKEFEEWVHADPSRERRVNRPGVTMAKLPAADHTFSNTEWHKWLTTLTVEWTSETYPSHC